MIEVVRGYDTSAIGPKHHKIFYWPKTARVRSW